MSDDQFLARLALFLVIMLVIAMSLATVIIRENKLPCAKTNGAGETLTSYSVNVSSNLVDCNYGDQ